MDRRTFVRVSGGSIGLLWLAPLGCKTAGSRSSPNQLGIRVHSVGSEHLIFDSDSHEYQLDPFAHVIVSFDDRGQIDNHIGQLGSDSGELNFPIAAALAPDGRMYVVERGNSRVQVFDANGRPAGSIGSDAHAPSDVAIDKQGNIFV